MDKIFDLDSVLLTLDKKGDSSYFLDFIHNSSFEVGVLRLNPGQKDTQGPHSEDELYFVVEGNGYINIVEKNFKIKKGSCIFVPSKATHYFHGNKERLVVL
ncbi:MAG TPA: cupin domain-containing protein, partial [Candidatus Nitrosocosmicus sp.]|nr:cupin domain-containing protein [Candidatus Nitrosocosmicus sp.]